MGGQASRRLAFRVFWGLACIVSAWTGHASAQARVLKATPALTEAQLVCELLLGDLFTPPVESTLRSGLPVIIDLACELRSGDREAGLGQFARSEVHYDVWEDRYSLVRGDVSRDFDSFEDVYEACRRYEALPLAPLTAMDRETSFSLRIRVAVNPLSGEERERMARWLAETVTDPGDPSSRELRLDLGGLIQNFFRGGDTQGGWGNESLFGPFDVNDLPLATRAAPPASDEGP